ncbi:MAG: hypothetical protein GY710_03150 [Desulfobacteraceae bacterium]|nr:hypothetical protein [Desulfobacteraceae bacterium]
MGESMDKLAQKASDEFLGGLYCSEAILKVYNEHLDLGLNENALKMATAFGAGFGGSKCSCGALTGVIMVISSLKGRTSSDDSVEEIFEITRRIHDEFKNKFRSACCKVISKKFEWRSDEHYAHCAGVVAEAAKILNNILDGK